MSNGFVDPEKIQRLMEETEEALRPLGLTMVHEGSGLAIAQDGQLIFQIVCLVRDSAVEAVTGKAETDKTFEQMMAENQKAKIREEQDKIKDALADPSKLMSMLFSDEEEEVDPDTGETCEHTMHPDGFCLKCGKGLT